MSCLGTAKDKKTNRRKDKKTRQRDKGQKESDVRAVFQVLALTIAVPVSIRMSFGPFNFVATFLSIELMKIVIGIVIGFANVSATLQLLLVWDFE